MSATTKSTRLLKLICSNKCGTILRGSAKAIDGGAPMCACGGVLHREGELPVIRPTAAPAAILEPRHTELAPYARARLNSLLAAVAGGFIPAASYVLAHIEAPGRTYLYGLVLASLVYSAPTLAAWAGRWCDGRVKAWGFCALLEGVMILSQIPALNLVGLAILVGINSASAWDRAKSNV